MDRLRRAAVFVAVPRIVCAEEAGPLLPAILRPVRRLIERPGFLLVQRRVVTLAQAQRHRVASR